MEYYLKKVCEIVASRIRAIYQMVYTATIVIFSFLPFQFWYR